MYNDRGGEKKCAGGGEAEEACVGTKSGELQVGWLDGSGDGSVGWVLGCAIVTVVVPVPLLDI